MLAAAVDVLFLNSHEIAPGPGLGLFYLKGEMPAPPDPFPCLLSVPLPHDVICTQTVSTGQLKDWLFPCSLFIFLYIFVFLSTIR